MSNEYDNQEDIPDPGRQEFEFTDEQKRFMNKIPEEQKKIYEEILELLNKTDDELWGMQIEMNQLFGKYDYRGRIPGYVNDRDLFKDLFDELVLVEGDLFDESEGSTMTSDTEGGRRKKSKKSKKSKKRKTIRKPKKISKKSKKTRRSTKRN